MTKFTIRIGREPMPLTEFAIAGRDLRWAWLRLVAAVGFNRLRKLLRQRA